MLSYILTKLNTKEDSNHIHKMLGTICLGNYIYRFFLLFKYGNMYLKNNISMLLIAAHGLLSCSSLIFYISQFRNPKSPMIYPEYRLHSIVFAMRSVLCCFICYFNLHFLYKIAICYLTMISADLITYNYKNDIINNGSTMKSMPFDEFIKIEDQQQVTFLNSSLQIGATINMLGTIDMAFSPMFGIQIAAFLMTLVRKGIITSRIWHIIYALSLWVNIIFAIIPGNSISFIFIQIVMYQIYTNIFFKYKINKYISWSLLFGLYYIYKEYYTDYILSYLLPIEYFIRTGLFICQSSYCIYQCKALFYYISR